MKVVKPITNTQAMLVSTTATETVPLWSGATAYAVGAVARYGVAAGSRIYRRLVAGTTPTAPDADTTNWLDTGPSNVVAMFDTEISTQTTATGALSMVLKPGFANSLCLFGLEGNSLQVEVRDGLGGPLVYSLSKTLDGTVISDWYQYFFEPSVQLAEVVLTNLPPYGNAHITITLTGSATVKCGTVLVGTVYDLGDTLYSPTAGIVDYSKKETDSFGVTRFVKRPYSKRTSAKVMLGNAQLNKVQRVLADLRATPCVWIGTDEPGYEPLTVFGFYKDFLLDVAYPTTSYCSLEIEGLI